MLTFVLLGLVFGIMYAIIEAGLIGNTQFYPVTGNPYHLVKNSISTIVQGLVMGFIFGIMEGFVFNKHKSSTPFYLRLLWKSFFYVTLMAMLIALLSLFSTSVINKTGLMDPASIHSLKSFLSGFGFWSVILYVGFVFVMSMLVMEMSYYIGDGVFRKFIFGQYGHPKEEERIFMFLDIKGSTPLAEKLGHVKYFRFLNTYYEDISKAILSTGGEVYHYVGDEVVVTWAYRNKKTYDLCITCFFRMKSLISRRSDHYLRQFGHVPQFKAGLHCGMVSTGRIGVLKKELVFTGDVLNTTSRMQSICNEHHVDILISEVLVQQLGKITAYRFLEVGTIPLRGKEKPLRLFTI